MEPLNVKVIAPNGAATAINFYPWAGMLVGDLCMNACRIFRHKGMVEAEPHFLVSRKTSERIPDSLLITEAGIEDGDVLGLRSIYTPMGGDEEGYAIVNVPQMDV